MVILDTCVLLWLCDDQTSLSKAARQAIQQGAGFLHVSAISAFEIAIKVRKKKLELPLPPQRWYEQAIKLHGLQEVPINSPDAITAAELPLLHNDPCDRFIIASAINRKLRIITPDDMYRKYPDVNVIW